MKMKNNKTMKYISKYKNYSDKKNKEAIIKGIRFAGEAVATFLIVAGMFALLFAYLWLLS